MTRAFDSAPDGGGGQALGTREAQPGAAPANGETADTEAGQEGQASERCTATIGRWRVSAGSTSAVLVITRESRGRVARLCRCSASDCDDLRARVERALAGLVAAGTDEELASGVGPSLAQGRVAAEVMPESDGRVEVVIDLATGTTVTQMSEVEGGIGVPADLQRSVASRVSEALRGLIVDGNLEEMRSALAEGDLGRFRRAMPRALPREKIPEFNALAEAALLQEGWAAEHKLILTLAADVAFCAQEYEVSLSLVERAQSLQGGDHELDFNISLLVGNCYAAQRKFDAAKLQYEGALARWPDVRRQSKAWAYKNLSSIYFSTERPSEAQAAVASAAQLRAESGVPLEPARTLAARKQIKGVPL